MKFEISGQTIRSIKLSFFVSNGLLGIQLKYLSHCSARRSSSVPIGTPRKSTKICFGIVLWELLTALTPFDNMTPEQATFAVCQKTIESSPCGGNCEGGVVNSSQLNLIDLVGSESSKAETTGVRRKEGSYINKSLLTLGTVSDNLLHDASSNQETLIFCSQTLRSKVQRDFEELPFEAFRPLWDSLNSLLKTFHKGPPKVRTQISLVVVALAVHVPAKDWGDGGIVNWLRDEMNSHPECIPSFLELLRVLPEEVFNYKIAARPDRRRQFEKELTSAIEIALNILSACLNIIELKEQVLEAFASWLHLRHRIPASTLASHPLVLTALSSLNSDILSEASVNGTMIDTN
ncbi:Transportin MOS14 [Camellia lanceoleosa]|uniref:Transportin MOS14 n=1 Tax=Camellia lanceoleosa TaxID=1840588 RepID=A0ACC0HQT6_9ERIC|nr:Transportin MOS14 [Camellia lanceoleosa]